MIVDLHSHYPMHLLADQAVPGEVPPEEIETLHGARRAALRLANRLKNYPGNEDKPAVTLTSLANSTVGVALSMLYQPFDEIVLGEDYGTPPQSGYFRNLVALLEGVEHSIAPGSKVTIAHTKQQLEDAHTDGKVALIHAVEGGFQFGATAAEIEENIAALADRGVAYITVAHLFWRQIATNAPALPFMKDSTYNSLFPQPRTKGLSDLGVALITSMMHHGILIDVTHMSERAIDHTLQVMKDVDPAGNVPLMATHTSCKAFCDSEYALSDAHIEAIAQRGGVIGLIACEHWMSKGLGAPTDFPGTMQVIRKHIDHINEVTKNGGAAHQFAAFGSDQDGFIKPALHGLDTPADFAKVEDALNDMYEPAEVQQICSGNALRVLDSWTVPV